MPSFRIAAALGAALVAVGDSSAAFVITFGSGTAVSTIDRQATFNPAAVGVALHNYIENGLREAVNDFSGYQPGFDPTAGNGGFSGGYHYADGGVTQRVTVAAADGRDFAGLEMAVGNGWGSTTTHVAYQALLDGIIIGSGAFSVSSGSVLGFQKVGGMFDTLLIGAYNTLGLAQGSTNSSYQAIALDNVRMQLDPVTVPLPATALPLAMCGVGLAFFRRRLAA